MQTMQHSNVSEIEDGPEESGLHVLTFGIEREIFALETGRVREVLDLADITDVPNSRAFIAGLVNVRGKIIPVVDLRLKFGLGHTERTRDARIIVIEASVRGEPTPVGLLTDRVYEVTELAPATLEEAPPIGMRWRTDLIRAIGKRGADFIIVMDVDLVLAAETGIASGGNSVA